MVQSEPVRASCAFHLEPFGWSKLIPRTLDERKPRTEEAPSSCRLDWRPISAKVITWWENGHQRSRTAVSTN
jgi:hypothetical protein